ncbi:MULTISPECIES: pseudouridine synthase [Methylotenera]|uniref:pseudouridine synthase n=1 Tax=Methylotenera TaxID=359407 RepID=UPI000366E2CA|nr:pseudouridine synthase [Methylotenera sp. 73s]
MLKCQYCPPSIKPILTTIKITKKSSETSSGSKAPVRRVDPARRDRTQPPPKPVIRDAVDVAKSTQSPKTEGGRQRNHRFDGKAHGEPFAEQRSDTRSDTGKPTEGRPAYSKSNENRPLRSELRAEVPNDSKPANHQDSPKPHKPAGKDTRITPRPDKNEPQYRQAPRRGGKVRDGYDAVATPQYGAAAKAAYKSSPVNVEMPRLSKVMAERGICSRREADEWIVNGWVKVDGEILETLGTRIKPDAEIVISAYAYEQQAEQVTILLHKPVGYVSGQAEDGYQPAIVLVHPDNEWMDDPDLNSYNAKEFQRGFLHGLAPAGRLDIDSTGLLVLTQDGRIARHLIGEDSSVEKEYLVRVEGELSDADLQRLNHGLSLDGEKLKPAKVSWQNEDQLRFVLREGKKRQIRRMCEMVGLFVVGLKRVRIGSVNLGKLPPGQWRYLRDNERF